MTTTSIGLTDNGARNSVVGDERELSAEPGSQDDSRLQPKAAESDGGIQGSIGAIEQAETIVHAGYPWRRLLRVFVMLIVYFVLEVVVKSLTVAQFLFVAWRRRPHDGMKRWGAMIAGYMNQMWQYCTFAADAAPWPFSPWPRNTDTT